MRRSSMMLAGMWLLACTSEDAPPPAGGGDTTATLAVVAADSVVPDSVVPPIDIEVAMVPRRQPGDTLVVGVVRAVGGMPFEQLVLQAGGSSVAVKGALRDELAKLEGAELRAWGKPTDNAPPTPPRAVEVTGYEILSVGGATPIVGVLALRDGALHLVGADTVRLEAVPEMLRTKPGAKVWLVGTREGSTLRVQSYGILREPQ